MHGGICIYSHVCRLLTFLVWAKRLIVYVSFMSDDPVEYYWNLVFVYRKRDVVGKTRMKCKNYSTKMNQKQKHVSAIFFNFIRSPSVKVVFRVLVVTMSYYKL